MSEVDWSKYKVVKPANTDNGAVDWGQFKVVKPANPEITKAESAGRAFYQGATAGFGDELRGRASQAMEAIGGLFGDSETEVANKLAAQGFKGDIGPLNSRQVYEQARNEDRAANLAAKEANPWTYALFDIAGSFVPTMLVPGLSVGKGASIMDAMTAGARYGVLAGAGNTNNDLTSKEGIIDTAQSGLYGAASGGIGQAIANKIQKVSPENIAREAEIQSAKAQGLERGTRNKLNRGDILEETKVRDIGRQGLESVNGEKPVVSLFANTKDMINRNQGIKESAASARQTAYDLIDKANASQFNPIEAAIEVENKVIGNLNPAYEDTKILMKAVDPALNNILSRGEQNISMNEAQSLLNSLKKNAKFDTSRGNTANEVAQDVYHTVRNYINNAAEKAGDKINISGLKDSIIKSNKQYSIAKNADLLLSNKLAREANKTFGLTDIIALSGQNPVIYFPKKIIEEYGHKGSAIMLDKISKTMARNPKAFGVFKNTLEQAARKSPQAFTNRVSDLLNNNLTFRNKVKALSTEQDR